MIVLRRHFRRVPWIALVVAAMLCCRPSLLHATKGDCSQPVTTGSAPTATDCLHILRVAVALDTCSPACICAPKGALPTTASDALVCLRKAVGQVVTLNCPCQALQTGDDFNDNSKDSTKWGTDEGAGYGALNETSHVLEYTCSPSSANDKAVRPWEASVFPYDADWEVQIDLVNVAVTSNNNQVSSFGISVVDANNYANEVYGELYLSQLGGPPSRTGFYSELLKNGVYVADRDSQGLAVSTGAVRIAFEASSKVITLFYDVDTSDGYSWVQFASFGLGGSGGTNANTNWGLSNADRFAVAVYGYSSNMVISAATMYGDNFLATGGVAP